MDMNVITSAASNALANIVLAVIALAGAYAVYYIRLAGAQVKEIGRASWRERVCQYV